MYLICREVWLCTQQLILQWFYRVSFRGGGGGWEGAFTPLSSIWPPLRIVNITVYIPEIPNIDYYRYCSSDLSLSKKASTTLFNHK